MYDVVALGELLIDFTLTGQGADGYPIMASHPGGAPANYLAAMAKFGAKTAMLGKVGNDFFGKKLLKTLEAAGIDTCGMIVAEDVFTTLAFVTLDEQGDRSFSFARKPGADTRLTFEELDLSIIDRARVFHFGTLSLTDEPSRSATYKAVEYAKSKGLLISFDPNLREPLWQDLKEARKQMLWGLSQADIVKISEEEIRFLWNISPEAGASYIREHYGVTVVFATCGANGCIFEHASGCGAEPALSGLQVADTTGAGDIFGGSAVWKLLQTEKDPRQLTVAELHDITAFACSAAGLSTTVQGGISSVPDLQSVLHTYFSTKSDV